ncbi:hypothetical protein BD560DRAFT_405106 [Blakeslea trispora]|nr:hypothetical protein BD560DRAFT_405106 [Blakeslea trispora]
MQTLQPQSQEPQQYFLNSHEQSVSDFLKNCHLSQYLNVFLQEGFDSVTSLLEITEDDMIFMNVKRGHRRLIQREIATMKGVPRDQPLVTNMMGAKYGPESIPSTALKLEDNRRLSNAFASNNTSNTSGYINSNPNQNNNLSGYETHAVSLPSPQSMNSGIGSSTTGSSGNSSSSGPMSSLRPRFQHDNRVSNGSSSSGASSMTDSSRDSIPNKTSPIITGDNDHAPGKDKNTNTNSNNDNSKMDSNASNNAISLSDIRSNSLSSNDDNDSIDTNGSAPTTKRKYRRHPKPDRNAPVKPPSAYIMFSNDARAELKNKNLSFAELAKIVGDRWKNLSHLDKQAYERMAMRAKDEYLASLEQYRQTPQYHQYQEYLSEFKSKQDNANRMIGRARKRAKPASPGSGSIADFSSNGNSNGNGSSGSGSADAYGDKESVIQRQNQRLTSDGDNNNDTSDIPQHPLSKKPSKSSFENSRNDRSYNSDNTNRPFLRQTPHPRHFHSHHSHHRSHHNRQLPPSSDSGYTSQSYYNSNSNDKSPNQWNYRSSQIMRGMLPVEFVHHTVPTSLPSSSPSQPSTYPQNTPSSHDIDMDEQEDEVDDEVESQDKLTNSLDHSADHLSIQGAHYGSKRRSPRFNKSSMQT